ncbi:TRAP transporter small permease [Spiribacter halobius]|uniref:TRAP transporter small permease protein n=1 Tax=Sediminicurvatus halobius TaxID=2182432 RepID=A0A2U2N0Y6_9GAMM|nr:TRAP transporter small permease [Spiribacter halobius]PWG62728.1 TRAP transporter permease DctQ [Spiribacter halobius]UEX77397.1 TRAP transporter small permease [Spiribacter halobius]
MSEESRTEAATGKDDDIVRQMEEATRPPELMDPDPGASPLDRLINRIVEAVGVTILVATVALVFVNATTRYTVGFTFIWVEEIVIGTLPWLGMCGMFLAIRRRQVIRIEFFMDLFPSRWRQALNLFAYLVAAAGFTYLALVSVNYVGLFGGDRTIYLKLERGWFLSAMLIGPAVAALAYLEHFVKGLLAARATGGDA